MGIYNTMCVALMMSILVHLRVAEINSIVRFLASQEMMLSKKEYLRSRNRSVYKNVACLCMDLLIVEKCVRKNKVEYG